ncbi:MAG: OmpA family protein [Thermodesulfobacteriota bacterium]
MKRIGRPILLAAIMALMLGLGAGPAGAQTNFFSVQVSAHKDAKSAAKDVAAFKAKGLEAFSRYESAGEKGKWHRVYVGRFASKKEAGNLAKKLKADGLITDYAVRAVEAAAGPPVAPGQAVTEAPAAEALQPGTKVETEVVNAPAGWEIIVDLSGSISDDYRCGGHSKHEAIFSILKKMNTMIPEHPYQSALRRFGYRRALTREHYTNLVQPLKPYQRTEFNLAIDDLAPSDAISPLGWAIAASEAEMDQVQGRKALIIMSDFKENADFGDPLGRTEALRKKFGPDLCVYSISVALEANETTLAQNVAEAGGCGKYYDGCRLLGDQAYFEAMIREIFGLPKEKEVKVVAPCPDADGDGVCDDKDRCPDTPKGAPVDERGCWIAAFAQFFDFNKAEVKKKFLPRLEAAAEIINANPQIKKVTIAGHTDNVGGDQFNQKLGLKRAEAVREVLTRYGVNKDRLAVKSFGEKQPVADNKTKEGRAKNRRVEFHVGDAPAR